MYGKCDNCGKERVLIRKTFYYPIKCECHSPRHFARKNLCEECYGKVTLPKETNVTFKSEYLMDIARNVLIEQISDYNWIELDQLYLATDGKIYPNPSGKYSIPIPKEYIKELMGFVCYDVDFTDLKYENKNLEELSSLDILIRDAIVDLKDETKYIPVSLFINTTNNTIIKILNKNDMECEISWDDIKNLYIIPENKKG